MAFTFGATSKPQKAVGANMVGSTYPELGQFTTKLAILKEWLLATQRCNSNTNLANKVDVISTAIESTHCDGALYHPQQKLQTYGLP